MYIVCYRSVYRKNKSKAIEAIKNAEHIIKDLGYHIVIFPEGIIVPPIPTAYVGPVAAILISF